ncbi:hypothetical protein HAX54_040661, partial [Datura stramonium]|nr:hypothetical protein [Datura stramonium]
NSSNFAAPISELSFYRAILGRETCLEYPFYEFEIGKKLGMVDVIEGLQLVDPELPMRKCSNCDESGMDTEDSCS